MIVDSSSLRRPGSGSIFAAAISLFRYRHRCPTSPSHQPRFPSSISNSGQTLRYLDRSRFDRSSPNTRPTHDRSHTPFGGELDRQRNLQWFLRYRFSPTATKSTLSEQHRDRSQSHPLYPEGDSGPVDTPAYLLSDRSRAVLLIVSGVHQPREASNGSAPFQALH